MSSPFEKKKGKSKSISKADTESLENSMQSLSLFGKTKSFDTHSTKSDYLPSLNKTTLATYNPKSTKSDDNTSVNDFQIPVTPKIVRTSAKGYSKAASIEGDIINFKTPDRRIKGR